MTKIIHRIAGPENTEVRVYDCGQTFNVTIHDNDADQCLPTAWRCPTREAALAKADKLAATGTFRVLL